MTAIDVQIASKAISIPTREKLCSWCTSALSTKNINSSLALRVVDNDEMINLNSQFRQQPKTTNVLSFPSDLPPELELEELGDIVICAPVVESEAVEQNKLLEAHWAHMVVHGTLHLQGYDHIETNDAEEMEALEEKIITGLGFPAPYSS